jgi:hypothetical protein
MLWPSTYNIFFILALALLIAIPSSVFGWNVPHKRKATKSINFETVSRKKQKATKSIKSLTTSLCDRVAAGFGLQSPAPLCLILSLYEMYLI